MFLLGDRNRSKYLVRYEDKYRRKIEKRRWHGGFVGVTHSLRRVKYVRRMRRLGLHLVCSVLPGRFLLLLGLQGIFLIVNRNFMLETDLLVLVGLQ
jgi:hypothetical protein